MHCLRWLPEAAEAHAGAVTEVVAVEQAVFGVGVSDEQKLVLTRDFLSLIDIGIGEDEGGDGLGGLTSGVCGYAHVVSPCALRRFDLG
jgi:hypothetical protein